ncbi:MAG TPA: hypothetical protein VKA95_14665 [Nitrososphaeraceae archaeon]|nr:hypothetical protein [Nitrososphaeraceae archaeon]
MSSSNVLSLAGKPYQNFVNSISSPESRHQYVYILRKYMESLQITDVDDLVRKDPKLIE